MRRALYVAPFGELSDPRVIVEIAEAAESSGWDGLFVWDHVWRDESKVQEVGDAWVSLAAVASRTERLVLGPMVVPLSRRRPQRVARESVALDRLSGGRLRLGVGLGVNTAGELSRFGEVDGDVDRAELLDEALELLDLLWSGERVVHRGRHFTADDVAFRPVALQQPRIPVWGAARGGTSMRPVRRAARLDGLFPVGASLRQLEAMVDEVRRVRGGLDGFDVVVIAPPGSTRDDLERLGATWALEAFSESARRDEVLAAASHAPPAL